LEGETVLKMLVEQSTLITFKQTEEQLLLLKDFTILDVTAKIQELPKRLIIDLKLQERTV